jgi:CBS-domain-containing membrane protein
MCRDARALGPTRALVVEVQALTWIVLDDEGRVAGIVTDRDACMAGYTQHAPLHLLTCASAMGDRAITARRDQTANQVVQEMATHKIRRIPVVDDLGAPVGIVSLNDLAIGMTRDRTIPTNELASTLAAICEHRPAAREHATSH